MTLKHPELYDIIARPELVSSTGCVLHVFCGYSAAMDCPTTVPLSAVTLEDVTNQFANLNKKAITYECLNTKAQVMIVGKILATGEILLFESKLKVVAQQKTP